MSTDLRKETDILPTATGSLLPGKDIAPSLRSNKHGPVSLSDLKSLRACTQLLLAHSLVQNNSNLLLLNSDTDAKEMLAEGWLKVKAYDTVGVTSFKFEPHAWRELRALRDDFLTEQTLSALQAYEHEKSALYPWVW